MSDVDARSTATAYATKSNIVVPPEAAPTAAHLTALATAAVSRMGDGADTRPTITAVKALKKG